MLYDCFLFFEEFDLLEIRLRETESVVDRWVVVEGTHTHQGRPRSASLRQHRDRFGRWWDRILHAEIDPTGGSAGEREHTQRNHIRTVLEQAGVQPDDVVHLCDADEITSAEALRRFLAGPRAGVVACVHHMAYYWLNCTCGGWGAARLGTWGEMLRLAPSPQQLRHGAVCPPWPDAGWHFSFQGGLDAVRAKLAAYSHEELNRPEYTDERWLRLCLATGLDLFRRPACYRFVDPAFLPPCCRDGGRFDHLWRDALFHEEWISGPELELLAGLVWQTNALPGDAVEVGSWEGRATVALAAAAHPGRLTAVDTWRGSLTEGEGHATVQVLAHRDVEDRFRRNVAALCPGNVDVVKADSRDYLASLRRPVRFAFVDGAHDYPTVRAEIGLLRERLVPGGVLSGHDILTATADRADLQGGVERAVRELLPGFSCRDNVWWWTRPS